MHFNKAELASLVTNPATRFDKEGPLIITERQEGIFWRTDVKLKCWCKLRGNLLFYLKDKNPGSSLAGVFVLEDCHPRILHEQPELEGYGFDLDFKESPTQHIITHSAEDRQEWVEKIVDCSNDRLNSQILKLKQKIAAATASSSLISFDMGNQIEPGLRLPASSSISSFPHDLWEASASTRTSTTSARTSEPEPEPIIGDLIQF